MTEDDFGHKQILKQKKSFSRGDRMVFTRNDNGVGVKNGTMGTITSLDKQTIQIKLDGEKGKEISFAPNLNPYFDQGWAITIHKSQGTTVDNTYVLASPRMTQNLTYVAMTRHREDVQVFGSNLDFRGPEKIPEALSKSGEKRAVTDYLDPKSLNKLVQKEDHLLRQVFTRVSNELEAMKAVSKRTFWQVADYCLGTNRDKGIRVDPEVAKEPVREETRAADLFKNKEMRSNVGFSRGVIREVPEILKEKPETTQKEIRLDQMPKKEDAVKPILREMDFSKHIPAYGSSRNIPEPKLQVDKPLSKQMEKDHDHEMEWER
jgi:hypothetical protein